MRTSCGDVLRGVAALSDMLDLIGNTDVPDGDVQVAKLLVHNEMWLRAVMFHVLERQP